jgi:uncharacterized membrane protein YkoI
MLLIGAALASAAPDAALAQRDQDSMYKGRKQGNLIPYGRIAHEVERRFEGRVVGQSIRQTGPDQWVYELRVLKKTGQLVMVIVDAQTGQIIRSSGGG